MHNQADLRCFIISYLNYVALACTGMWVLESQLSFLAGYRGKKRGGWGGGGG